MRVTASLPPSTQDGEHTLIVSWLFLSSFALPIGTALETEGKVEEELYEQLAFWTRVLQAAKRVTWGRPKIKRNAFISEMWLIPSHVVLSLPRSNDSLHFWHFSFSKEKKHQSRWSQICFKMGNENIFPWKPEAKYSETSSAHFLKPKLNTALPWAMFVLAHFPGSDGCSWSFQP